MNVTALELLTHLWSEYGTISSAQLDDNKKSMRKAWSPPMSFETLLERLEYGMTFSKAGNDPITVATALRDGYPVFIQADRHSNAVRLGGFDDKLPHACLMRQRLSYGGCHFNNNTKEKDFLAEQ
jgi:hypothetical protein